MKSIISTSVLIILGFAIYAPIIAQPPEVEWFSIFGEDSMDIARSVQQTLDGGYIYAGETKSFGALGVDAFLVKTDSSGNIEWYRLYGGTGAEVAYTVQQTSDGGFALIGVTSSFGSGYSDAYLVKINSQGDTLWTRTYGGSYIDRAHTGQQTSDGGYVLAGFTRPVSGELKHVYLVKTDSLGDTLWTQAYEGSHDLDIWSVQQTHDDGYILGGIIYFGMSTGYDYYLARTDSMGDTLWTRTFGGPDVDWAWAVKQTTDGGYIIGGSSESFGAGTSDMYVVKTDSRGDTLWTRTYGGIWGESATSILLTEEGGYIFAGATASFGDNVSLYLVKTDAQGDTIWTLVYGGEVHYHSYSAAHTFDGGYIIAGTETTYEYPNLVWEDCLLVKVGPDTSVSDAPSIQWVSHPKDFILHPAYPNPFNPTTTISYDVPVRGLVKVNIYNVLGQHITTLLNQVRNPGTHHVTWNAADSPSGIYFVRLTTSTHTQTIKMVLLK